MTTYILRRILIAIPILLGVTILNFAIVNLAPGSPVDMILDPNATAESIEAKKEQLGLNDPIYVQYWHWLTNLLQGNLGYSYTTYEPVSSILGDRLWPTISLMGITLIVSLVVAIPLGIYSAVRQNSFLDYFATGSSFLAVALPNFFLGLGLIYVFSVQLGVLPSGGMSAVGGDRSFFGNILYYLMPVFVLATGLIGKIMRFVRASVIEILGQDYLRTARAKGLSEIIVVNKHAFKNALIPIITIIGLEIPMLFGGAVVTEQIFSWPGIGQLTISSILSRDYSTLMAINLMAAVIVVVSNLLTDIAYSFVDPRIKYQ